MLFNKSKKIVAVLILASTLLGIFAPVHDAHAAIPIIGALVTIAGYSGGISGVSVLIRNIAVALTEAIVWLLSKALANPNSQPPTVLKLIWGFMRNFANIFFVLLLIIMAFGTIFNIKNLTVRDLFPYFLIAAVLINFSFVISDYIAQAGRNLTVIFLNQFSETNATGTFFDMFSTGFSLKTLARPDIGFLKRILLALTPAGAMTELTDALIAILFLVVIIVVCLITFFFVAISAPIVWALAIISPFAWLGLVLPGRKMWNWWWKEFLSWTFWLPAYYFVLMLLSIILKGLSEGTRQADSQDFLHSVIGMHATSYFLLTIIFILCGLWASRQIGTVLKGGASKGWSYATTAAKYVGMAVGTYTGVLPKAQGIMEGGKMRFQDIVARGGEALPSFLRGGRLEKILGGGMREQTKIKAEAAQRVGRVFGGQVLTHAAQETKDKNIEDERKRLLGLYHGLGTDAAGLAQLYYDPNISEEGKLAIAQMRAEGGFLDQDPEKEIEETLRGLGGINTAKGTEYFNSVKRWLDQGTAEKLYNSFSVSPSTSFERLALDQLRAEKGWFNLNVPVTDPNSASNEITRAIRELGGIQNEAAQKYLEAAKNNVNKATINELYRTMSGEDKIRIAEIKAEKGWEESPDEVLRNINEMGPDTARAEKYMASLEKSFSKIFGTAAKQLEFARDGKHPVTGATLAVPESLKKTLYANLASKSQLSDETELKAYLGMIENDSKENKDKAKKAIEGNIRNIARNEEERTALLNTLATRGATGDKDLGKIVAKYMITNKEIGDYRVYRNMTTNLFNETDAESLEAREVVEKSNPLLAAQIEDNEKVASGAASSIGDSFEERLRKMSAERIMDSPNDIWDIRKNQAHASKFGEKLLEKIKILENSRPTVKATKKRNGVDGQGFVAWKSMYVNAKTNEQRNTLDMIKTRMIRDGYAWT